MKDPCYRVTFVGLYPAFTSIDVKIFKTKQFSRANGDTLSEKEFYVRRAKIHGVVFPVVKPYVLVSEGANMDDEFIRELAIRERANRVGILQVYKIHACIAGGV